VGGATSISLTGGTIGSAGGSCAVSVKVKATTGGAKVNTTGAVSSTQGGAGLTATDTLSVGQPPTVTKSFAPTQISVGGTSTLTISFTNPNAFSLSNLAISDTFPADLEVDATPMETNTCGGTFAPTGGATSISLSGGSLAASPGSCAISVKVKATSSGVKTNTTGNVSTTETGAGSTGTANLTVVGPPDFSKTFTGTFYINGAPIGATETGNTATISLTTAHGFSAGQSVTIAGVGVAGYNGTFTIASVPNSFTFTYTNPSAGLASSGGGTATSVSTLASVPFGAPSTLNFTITNNNTTAALTGIGFTDVLPTGLSVVDATTPNVCGAGSSLTVTAATRTIQLTGGNLAAGSPSPTSCSIPVTVTGNTVGAQVNTTQAITATESGAGGTATATLTVIKANTALSNLTDSPDPTVVGEPYTVGFTLNAVAPGTGTPGGTVMVSDNAGGTCTATLPVTSCSLTSLSVGAKTLSFSYGGDANFNASTNTAGHQVNAASTTTTITNAAALGTATVVGQSYAVTWDVAVNLPGTLGAALTGNVTVDAGGGNTCTAAVSAGTCNIISTTAGLKSITATYAGDTNYIGSTSSPATPHTVNKADTTTTITNAASLGSTPTVVGESYAVNWSVAVNLPGALGAALTGNVTVDAGGGNTCTAAVSAGTCNIISTTAGLKSITATYAGDGNYQGSTSASAAHTVNKPGTTTTINSDLPAPSVTGQAYTVSVSVGVVPPGMGTPTGTVNVNDGTGGSCVVTLSGGMGSCSLTSTTAGTKTLTASYLGDTNFEVSSGTKMHQVDKANTTAVINSDAPDASVVGQPVTVAYTVTANLPGGGIPTGNVLVTDGVNSCTGTLNASGQGSCTVALFTPGVRTLTATYQSDANYNASPASAGAGHQVNPANTTTAVTSSPNPSVFGQPVTFTATVTASAPGAGTPTGTVTFTIDGNPQVPVTLNGSGQASLTVSSLTVAGSPHAVSAAYNGSASYNTSTGTLTGGQVVNKANTATTITSDNPDSSAVGQNVTVNFTVTPVAPGAGPRTGTVTITVSGGSETCTGTLDGSGTGSCTLALTVPGDRTLTATYNGDANFNGSSDTEAHTVVAPPVIAKSFNPMAVPLNGVSTLTLAITNPAVNTVALTGVSVTDNFLPGAPGIVVHTTPAATNSCATGTFAPVAGANSISLSGATIPVGTTCNFTVQVRGTISGPQVNTTGNVSSTNGGTGNTATATLQVNVPPVITPINLARAAGTTTANLQIATATDVEDPEDQLVVQISTDGLNFFNSVTTGNVTIALVDQVPGGSVNPTAAGAVLATITTPCNATVGPLNLFLRATDTGGQLDTKPWTLTITPNTPPVLSYGTQTITAGTTPMFNPATGPSDNGTLNPLVLQPISPATGLMLSLNPATGQLAVTSATLIGNYTVTVTATDQCGAVTNASFTVNVICPTITLAPASLPGGTVNTAYSQTVSAAPSGTTYSYAVTSGALPNGLTLNAATGALTGTPTLSGTFNFRVTASGWGGCTGFRDYVIIVVCPTITLTPASLPGGTVGTAYNQTVSAAPAGTYNYAVSSGALPTGLSLNAATGAITGTPTASGVFGFTLTASSGGCSGSQAYSVTIVCPAITLAPATLPGAQAGVAYDQTVTANPAGAYTFSLVAGNLPPGLNLNAATGQLSGLATATGNYNFTLKAQAASGCSGTQAYTLTVTCPVISVNPASGALSGGTVGTAYNQSFSATPAGNYSFTKTSGTLPPGLSLNSASGLLSGTPTTQGTYSFTVTATGFGTCTGSRAYTLTIAASCATITLPALPATGTVGVNYSGNLAATTPSASYTFTVDSGALPPGLTINNLFGQLSGKPTVAGVYNFTLKATRSNGCSGTRAYTITVGGGSFARLRNDFDGDGKSDLILRQTGTGNWLLTLSGSGATETVSFGAATDLPVFGDYDGDGKTDLAVYQSGAATWLLRLSSTGATVEQRVAGLPADAQVTPLNADFDGDGRTDLALWESATASWFVQRSTDGKQLSFQFGTAGDVAVPADYDGDGRADLAVFERASARWRIQQSGDNSAVEHQFGTPKDAPLASDFDGDGRADLAVWRAAEGALYVQASRTAPALRLVVGVASAADWLLLGDYDGDGKTEPAVWRAIEARWYLRFSSNAALFIQVPGQLGLVPVTNGQ
jgi:hypothetical protein